MKKPGRWGLAVNDMLDSATNPVIFHSYAEVRRSIPVRSRPAVVGGRGRFSRRGVVGHTR